jgi:hypothetical protein
MPSEAPEPVASSSLLSLASTTGSMFAAGGARFAAVVIGLGLLAASALRLL